MDAKSHLLDQMDSLYENLGRALKAIGSEQISKGLPETVKGRLELEIGNNQRDLNQLRKQIANGMPLKIAWEDLLRTREGCKHILSECLGVVEGTLFRSAGLDEEICLIADSLLRDLSPRANINWSSTTILGSGDTFDHTANVIRLRFPEFSIWNLPLIAHELGHLLEFQLEGLSHDFPIATKLRSEKVLDEQRKTANAPHLRELICDLFGVYTLGPAFASTCIYLNFDPLTAFRDQGDHPSHQRRVHFLLNAIERIDESHGNPPQYHNVLQILGGKWNESLQAAGVTQELSQEEIDRLGLWLDQIYRIFETSLLPSARYPVADSSGWLVAQNLCGVWSRHLNAGQDLKPDLSIASTIRDVLNAAWLCRIYHPESKEEIGKVAKELCLEIAKK